MLSLRAYMTECTDKIIIDYPDCFKDTSIHQCSSPSTNTRCPTISLVARLLALLIAVRRIRVFISADVMSMEKAEFLH